MIVLRAMKISKRLLLILAAPLVLLFLVALVLYDRQRAANEPIAAPGVSLDAEPIAPELQAAVDAWWAVRGGVLDADLVAWTTTVGNMTDDEWAAVEPLIAAYRALVERPDYFMQAIDLGESAPMTPYPSFGTDARAMARLMMWQSGLALESGDHAAALDLAASIAHSARIDRYSAGFLQGMGAAVLTSAVRAWLPAIRATGDPDLLRASRDAQDRLASQLIFLPPDLELPYWDHVGVMRDLQRRGVEIEITPLGGNEVMRTLAESQMRYLTETLIPRVRTAGGNTSSLEQQLTGYQMQYDLFDYTSGPADFILHPLRTRTASILRGIGQSALDGTHLYINDSLIRFDLLRLETAERLYTLATGAPPQSINDLVPDYLDEALADRFDPEGGLYRRAGVWYSIGPDGIDDGASVRYEYRVSPLGDIFLPRAEPPIPPSDPPPAP